MRVDQVHSRIVQELRAKDVNVISHKGKISVGGINLPLLVQRLSSNSPGYIAHVKVHDQMWCLKECVMPYFISDIAETLKQEYRFLARSQT